MTSKRSLPAVVLMLVALVVSAQASADYDIDWTNDTISYSVETYGAPSAIAYNPNTGQPALAFVRLEFVGYPNPSRIHVYIAERTSGGWPATPAAIVTEAGSLEAIDIGSVALAFASNGDATIAYGWTDIDLGTCQEAYHYIGVCVRTSGTWSSTKDGYWFYLDPDLGGAGPEATPNLPLVSCAYDADNECHMAFTFPFQVYEYVGSEWEFDHKEDWLYHVDNFGDEEQIDHLDDGFFGRPQVCTRMTGTSNCSPRVLAAGDGILKYHTKASGDWASLHGTLTPGAYPYFLGLDPTDSYNPRIAYVNTSNECKFAEADDSGNASWTLSTVTGVGNQLANFTLGGSGIPYVWRRAGSPLAVIDIRYRSGGTWNSESVAEDVYYYGLEPLLCAMRPSSPYTRYVYLYAYDQDDNKRKRAVAYDNP